MEFNFPPSYENTVLSLEIGSGQGAYGLECGVGDFSDAIIPYSSNVNYGNFANFGNDTNFVNNYAHEAHEGYEGQGFDDFFISKFIQDGQSSSTLSPYITSSQLNQDRDLEDEMNEILSDPISQNVSDDFNNYSDYNSYLNSNGINKTNNTNNTNNNSSGNLSNSNMCNIRIFNDSSMTSSVRKCVNKRFQSSSSISSACSIQTDNSTTPLNTESNANSDSLENQSNCSDSTGWNYQFISNNVHLNKMFSKLFVHLKSKRENPKIFPKKLSKSLKYDLIHNNVPISGIDIHISILDSSSLKDYTSSFLEIKHKSESKILTTDTVQRITELKFIDTSHKHGKLDFILCINYSFNGEKILKITSSNFSIVARRSDNEVPNNRRFKKNRASVSNHSGQSSYSKTIANRIQEKYSSSFIDCSSYPSIEILRESFVKDDSIDSKLISKLRTIPFLYRSNNSSETMKLDSAPSIGVKRKHVDDQESLSFAKTLKQAKFDEKVKVKYDSCEKTQEVIVHFENNLSNLFSYIYSSLNKEEQNRAISKCHNRLIQSLGSLMNI